MKIFIIPTNNCHTIGLTFIKRESTFIFIRLPKSKTSLLADY